MIFLLLLEGFKELLLILALLPVNPMGVTLKPLMDFFLLRSLDTFLMLMPLGFTISTIWTGFAALRSHLILFLELIGGSPRRFFIKVLFVYLLSLVIIAFLQEKIAKDLRKQSEIILEDNILRKPNLQSKHSFSYNRFIRIADHTYIYFSKVHLDNPDRATPTLDNVLVWTPHGTPIFRLSTGAEFSDPETITLFKTQCRSAYKSPSEHLILRADKDPCEQEFKIGGAFPYLRLPSVSFVSLTYEELYHLLRISHLIDSDSMLYSNLLALIVTYLLLPFAGTFITLRKISRDGIILQTTES